MEQGGPPIQLTAKLNTEHQVLQWRNWSHLLQGAKPG